MKNSGTAIMGSAVAEGPDRAVVAVKNALSSPLLNDNKITGASNILLYIASGKEEITFDEVTEITDYIQNEAGQNAEIIWGNGYDEALGNKISITLIATGFKSPDKLDELTLNREVKKKIYTLGDSQLLANTKKVEIFEKPAVEETPVFEEKTETPELLEVVDITEKPMDEPDFEQTDESVEEEIVLIKKEKPVELQKPDDVPIEVINEPVLIVRKQASEEPKEENALKLNFDVPITTEHNKNLWIKHTVGDFPRKPERPQAPVRSEEERVVMDKKAEERQKKLRELSLPLNLDNDTLDAVEKVPAYLRRNVQLNSVTPSSESSVSKYSLGESDENNNSDIQARDIPYLHNKPD